jgi:signal transduction histidine kinase
VTVLAGATVSPVATAMERSIYHPIRARIAVAFSAVAAGAFFRLGLGLPLHAGFFIVTAVWFAGSITTLRWFARQPPGGVPFPARFVLFAFEVLVAVWLAHYIGASSWLATLFLLFPTIEWNLLYPGARGRAGSSLAVAASAVLIAGEAVGVVRGGTLLPGVEPLYADPRYAVGAFLVSAFAIFGLATVVGRYAEAGRRQSRELAAANARLLELSRDVQASRGKAEAAYAQLRSAQAELITSARMASLGNLIAGVAHEINTPLGALNSNHDTVNRALQKLKVILEDEVVDEHELEDVRRIVRAIDGVMHTNEMAVSRMVKLVDSLRTFGRVDRSDLDRVDLHQGVDSTLAILSHELRDRIQVVRDYGDLPRVECYPHQVHQVFMNLFVNAIQAMKQGGTLTIRTRAEGEQVVLQVEDTGIGIAPAHLERIFDPGFTTKGGRMGMGMGLLITRQIVDRHGGRITVASEPGTKTVFTVRLPVRLPAPPEASAGAGI